jgi:HAE1 family hydrophobic/amphiphilic exporter-1
VSPADFSVRHPVSIMMLIAILVGLGFVSLVGLPIEMFPELEFPMISVHTTYEGVAPQEVEERVTKPIERAVASVEQVKRIRSFTHEGSSFVLVEFNWGADTEVLRIDVREKLDAIRRLLPDDIDDPMVSRKVFGGDDQAIRVAVSSDVLPLAEVRRLAEDVLKARFESIDGVATVDVYGGLEREIQVNVLPNPLLSYGIPLNEVSQALQGANLNNPGGRIDRGRDEFLVRTVGKFRSLEEIRRLPIRQQDSAPITIGDVAEVVDTHKEIRSLSRFNGRSTVELAVIKETQGNVVAISDAAHAKIAELTGQFPQVQLGVAFDAAPYIRRSITDVRENASWGGFFAILVLWPFLSNRRWRAFAGIAALGVLLLASQPFGGPLATLLGSFGTALSLTIITALAGFLLHLLWRSSPATLVVSLAMPISIVATFILIHFAGLTLNMVSLGGLALGIGMLVDNSVVVIENISRHMALGRAPRRAAVEGSSEVTLAILVSTLTTLAVFLPIAWVQGIAREVFNDLSLTVSFSLATSLLVSVTIVPMLASKFLPRPEGATVEGNVTVEDEIASLRRPQARMREFLLSVLSRRRRMAAVLGTALGIFALSIVGLALHPKGFFPESDSDVFAITIRMPKGTTFSILDDIARRAEVIAEADPDVKSVFASVRAGDRILVGVTLLQDRSRHTKDIQADLRHTLSDVPDAEVGVYSFSGGGGGRPVDIHVLGDDPERLAVLGTIVRQKLETVPGAVDVRTSMEKGRPELRVEIDRLRVADRNLSVRSVAEVVETAMEGRVVGQYTDGGDEVDIRVQYKPSERAALATLRDLVIRNAAGVPVVLREVARIHADRGPVEIRRMDQRRMIQVESNLEKGTSIATVAYQLEARLRDVPFPVGYSWEFSGEEERRSEAFGGLAVSLAIAIVLVYMIMAALFESLMQPFVIMVTLPLAVAGVYAGLAVFGHDLTVPAYVGIIMLAGIVVNNAIVLLDYVNRLRRRGVARRDALALGVAVRLRPILMTAGTTILGMTPMALGLGRGSNVLQALAAGVVGGLAVSTVLTLLVVPCVYDLTDRLAARLRSGISQLGVDIDDPFARDSS